jgi:hypothetical protein
MKRDFAVTLAMVLCLSQSARAKGHSTAAATSPDTPQNTRANYVGDTACRSCHAGTFDSYHQTAHHRTSMLPSHDSILGSFTPGDNILKTANPDLSFRMEQRVDGKVDGFFQTAVAGTPPHTNARSERFAIVVGSGEKGQTYLYWDEDQLFQLPVSYWTRLGWVNSPGYRDGFANFDRPIIPRCLECHANYFEAAPPPINRYSTAGFTLGIECEKCHGPGREHIERERSKSAPPASASAILNPARFSRDRQMDLCAWCHAGHGRPLRPSFSYLPGEPLAESIDLPPPDPGAPLDVHGNQVELLKQSRCFRSSAMTCITCHDVHTAQHNLVDFSQKCLSCHKPDSATFARADHPLTKNCIDCHMPKQQTNLIVFDWKGTTVRPEMRNHWIKIYPESKAARVTMR